MSPFREIKLFRESDVSGNQTLHGIDLLFISGNFLRDSKFFDTQQFEICQEMFHWNNCEK